MSQAEARADHIIEARGGAVLGALTILKEDYFPGEDAMSTFCLPDESQPSNWSCCLAEYIVEVRGKLYWGHSPLPRRTTPLLCLKCPTFVCV